MTESWTWHGGGLEPARRHYGDGPMPWMDLSTGINPHPWPGAATMAFDWQRLPEPHALGALETAAADYFGLAPDHVCAVPGTEIGLRLMGRLIGGPAWHVTPSYRTHGAMIPGSAPISWPDAMMADGTLILANPNNPDGRTIDRGQMRQLLDRRAGGQWLLVDEAFADSQAHPGLAPLVGGDRRLIVFRSFGKFFGLAGVRLGFVLGPPSILARLRLDLGAWPISAAAIAIGTAAYRDRDWIATTRDRLCHDAAALDMVLARAGHRPTGDCPLFRLIETDDARALFDHLARNAILTRPFADQPRWLRIGLPPDADGLARLAEAISHR